MSKLWPLELMRPHFLWICVLRLDFPVSEEHASAKEALSVVRVFMASPSDSLPRILPPASSQSHAQGTGSPRHRQGLPPPPGCSPSWALPRLDPSETNTCFLCLVEIDPMDSKIEGELAGKSD